eukprot:6187059-Pleurochrysis_carterae.AAC.3
MGCRIGPPSSDGAEGLVLELAATYDICTRGIENAQKSSGARAIRTQSSKAGYQSTLAVESSIPR